MMIPRGSPELNLGDIAATLRRDAGRPAFEQAVAARAGARHALAFNYAHAGFWALLTALDLRQAEIILPAYTCKIMADVVIATGNVPVFVDIGLADYNMDLDALPAAITPRTRMIVATHMFGYPADVARIRAIADEYGGGQGRILIVEDAALVFPGAMHGFGLQGDVGLFSFGPGKPLFTLRGGIVVTDETALYQKLAHCRDQEMDALPSREWAKRWALLAVHTLLSRRAVHGLFWRLNLSKGSLQRLPSARQRHAGEQAQGRVPTEAPPGEALPDDYATRYADLQARLGLRQLEKEAAVSAQRQALAAWYHEGLQGLTGVVPAPVVEGASYVLYSVRVRDREDFCRFMRQQGVETGRTFAYALSNEPGYRSFARGVYPYAEQTAREVVNLPAFTGLTRKQVEYVLDCVHRRYR